jgi:hypothetical protein
MFPRRHQFGAPGCTAGRMQAMDMRINRQGFTALPFPPGNPGRHMGGLKRHPLHIAASQHQLHPMHPSPMGFPEGWGP